MCLSQPSQQADRKGQPQRKNEGKMPNSTSPETLYYLPLSGMFFDGSLTVSLSPY